MNLIISNNIVTNNLVNAVRTGKEQIRPVHTNGGNMARIRFRVVAGICAEFSEFDMAVLAYINGVWVDASNPNNTFTLTDLCRSLGCCASGSISPAMREEAATSLERLASVRVGMDVEQDFEPHRKTYMQNDITQSWEQATGVHWKKANPLIVLDRKETVVHRSGQCGDLHNVTYTIKQEPLLYTYSRVTGQFVTIPADRLRIYDVDEQGNLTGTSLPMTKTRIAETFWAARQVERMRYAFEHPQQSSKSKSKKKKNFIPQKNPSAAESTILLATMFDRAGLSKRDASRHKKRHLDFLRAVMSCWAAQGTIPAWEFRTKLFGRVDAIVLSPGVAAVPEQETTAAVAEPAPSPSLDSIFGVRDTILGAIDSIFGASSGGPAVQKRRLQSLLEDTAREILRILKYSKYFIPDTPARR